MQKGLTDINIILDRSGSMHVIKDDVIGGLNSFISEQKKVKGTAKFSLVLFNTIIETKIDNIDIQSVQEFSQEDYFPNDCTALLEASIKTIDNIGKRLSKVPESERPEKVIVAIMTDGQENASSSEYTKEMLGERIKHQTDVYKWEFIFLGANFDVFAEAKDYNIPTWNTQSYTSTQDLGTKSFTYLNASVTGYRGEN